MEQDKPPEKLGNYGDAHAKIHDLRDMRIPVKDILAALAVFDAPKKTIEKPVMPSVDATGDIETILQTRKTAAEAFCVQYGINFIPVADMESYAGPRAPIDIPMTTEELKKLDFMKVTRGKRVNAQAIHSLVLFSPRTLHTSDGRYFSLKYDETHEQILATENPDEDRTL